MQHGRLVPRGQEIEDVSVGERQTKANEIKYKAQESTKHSLGDFLRSPNNQSPKFVPVNNLVAIKHQSSKCFRVIETHFYLVGQKGINTF